MCNGLYFVKGSKLHISRLLIHCNLHVCFYFCIWGMRQLRGYKSVIRTFHSWNCFYFHLVSLTQRKFNMNKHATLLLFLDDLLSLFDFYLHLGTLLTKRSFHINFDFQSSLSRSNKIIF